MAAMKSNGKSNMKGKVEVVGSLWSADNQGIFLSFEKNIKMQPIIEQRKEELRNICEKLKIRRLYAFGSAVTSDKFRENSDIDFLISFEDTISP